MLDDLLSGLNGGSLMKPNKIEDINLDEKKVKGTADPKKIRAYSISYTSMTNIPRKYCLILNSRKQLEALTHEIDAKTNMRLLVYICQQNPLIKTLLQRSEFEGAHIAAHGIYIDYTNNVGIHILPRNNWKREIIIYNEEEDIVHRDTYDSDLTITLEKLELEFNELGLNIEEED
jgi:hypothetical protein